MKALLDTCCLVWAVSAPDQLSAPAREALCARDTEVFVSPISCAEIACLSDRGRIRLSRHWRTWFDEALSRNGWQVIDISLALVQEAYSLPGDFHRDPADRILVATARHLQLTLITADRKILDYPHVRTMW
ncbi:MAG: type II toxin-antitoxin system VapC family toxin [Lentisphaerae bacterium]|nr:type II toxin-antitoxin system VapC family toxin [Lentisphaerota bacterium]